MEKLASPQLPVLYFVITLIICLNALYHSGINMHRVLGLALVVVAYLLWITARRQLGQAFSQNPKATILVTSGLYSKLRHPLYMFQLLVLIGLTVFFWNLELLLLTILVSLFWSYRRRQEEILLAKTFGKKYSSYKQSSWF
jgi:protein-S-isoprenylcysteine O-methyltransferase Ste14